MAAFGTGYIGGCMSVADALAALYGRVMNVRPEEPRRSGRDYLVMSKGHCGTALCSALALRGFFPVEWLYTLNRLGSRLPSHCNRDLTPGVDASTGSLRQGASFAAGFAPAKKLRQASGRVYAILGDGELQEGQVREAAQFAAHHKPDKLTLLIDNNGAPLDGRGADISDPFDIRAKFSAFGFAAENAASDDPKAIATALERSSPADIPRAVVLKTVKGAGCIFAERVFPNHHPSVTRRDAEDAIIEIEHRYRENLRPGGEPI